MPTELGYYDLREPQIRVAQAELAAQHGLSAFCYYHYWFNGRRLLERPFGEVLASGSPDFPFLLCWANENWTRVWDGGPDQVLMDQAYGADDDLAHIRMLAPVFADPRYVRIDGRPVFLVYRAGLLPEPRRTADTWRTEAERLGLPAPYLCQVQSFPSEEIDPATIGFDAAIEFAPQWRYLPYWRRTNRVLGALSGAHVLPRRFAHHVVDYGAVAARMLAKPAPAYRWHRAVTPGWDNTPRRTTGGVVLNGRTPEVFRDWTARLLIEGRRSGSPLLFVNAWNEWAEGAYLEPDRTWGRAFLEAHAAARAIAADPAGP